MTVPSGLPTALVVLLFLLGAGGIGALGNVLVDWVKSRRAAEQGDRSVAIDEVDKAIPGLGEIITQLRTHANELDKRIREDLEPRLAEWEARFRDQQHKCAAEIADARRAVETERMRNIELVGKVYLLEGRVAELEGRQ